MQMFADPNGRLRTVAELESLTRRLNTETLIDLAADGRRSENPYRQCLGQLARNEVRRRNTERRERVSRQRTLTRLFC